jgi:hypothetical protein
LAFLQDFGLDPNLDSYRLARLRELIDNYKTKAVIKFIHQNPDTTVDKVAKHLQKEKVCSRLTTLSIVKDLLDIGLIIDNRKGKYFHSLSYNENFNFWELARRLLKDDVEKDLRFFDKFVFVSFPTEEQIKVLREHLDATVNHHYRPVFEHMRRQALDKGKKKPTTSAPSKVKKSDFTWFN